MGEAENFSDRVDAPPRRWLIIPQESPGDVPHLHYRGKSYIQALPDRTPEHPARLLANRAFARTQAGDYAGAEALLRESLAQLQSASTNPQPDVAITLENLGVVLQTQNKNTEAETTLRQAIGSFRELAKEYPRESDYPVRLGHSQWKLSDALLALGRKEEAEQTLREALNTFGHAVTNFPTVAFLQQEHGYTALQLAAMLEREGRLDAAEAECRLAIALHEKASAQFPNNTIFDERLGGLKLQLVALLCRQGKLDKAEVEAMARQAGNARTLNALAWRLATDPNPKLRDGPSAVSLAEKAVAESKRQDPWFLSTLAAAYAEVGQFTNAVAAQQEAIPLLKDEQQKEDFASGVKLFAAGIPYRESASLATQARDLLSQGKFAEAEPVARECLALREQLAPDDWRTFNSRSMLGHSLLGQKKYDEAEPLLLSGYEGLKQREQKIPAAGKVRLQEAIQRLVQLYEAMGRAGQAAEWKQKLGEFEERALAERKSSEALQSTLRKGQAACAAENWQEAAGHFASALRAPEFDWAAARQSLETSDHWMALAFVRAGDYQNHLALCRELAVAKGNAADPAGGALRAILLPANPAPELLTLASNALPSSETAFTNAYELAWFRFHRSLLEYRSGRYAEALASARQAAEWRGKFCRVYALIIQSMASKRLGQNDKARKLWQQANDSIPELRKEPQNLTNTRNLLLIQLFLEEAASLLGPDDQKALPQPAGSGLNPSAPTPTQPR